MKTITTCLVGLRVAAVAAVVLIPPLIFAQEEIDSAGLQQVLEQYGSPGDEHKVFDSLTGNWAAENTYWTTPDAPAMTSSGKAKVRLLLGGRYLAEHYQSQSADFGEFEGQGTLAYDRVAREFVHTWIDSMGTGIMISRGQLAQDGKSIVMRSIYKDPQTMQDLSYRIVTHLGDGSRRLSEMFVTYPAKEEYKLMQIVYTRAEKAGEAERNRESEDDAEVEE